MLKAPEVNLRPCQKEILEQITKSRTARCDHQKRARLILLIEEWIHTRQNQEGYNERVDKICDLYRHTAGLEVQGTHAVSVHAVGVDEKTCTQALKRKAIAPMKQNRAAWQDNEYTRHGTQRLIASLEVAVEQVINAMVQEPECATSMRVVPLRLNEGIIIKSVRERG